MRAISGRLYRSIMGARPSPQLWLRACRRNGGELAWQIASLDRPEGAEREVVFVEDPMEHRLDLIGPHAVDRGEHRVDREERAEAHLLPREAIHPGGGRLEGQHQVALQMVLRPAQLVRADAVLLQEAQLLHERLHDFAE